MPSDPFRWCRRIFASVDVVGSTAFKHRLPENSGAWAHVFRQFFDEFPTTLRACFEKLDGVADGKPSRPMSVWKFVGDEILFESELTRHEEVAFHVLAFKDALNEYAQQFRKKPELNSLALKGTIWGAGFPVSNVEVSPAVGDERHQLRDYLGPCVDQGFRLTSLADPRRIPIAADIAYMLAMTTLRSGVSLKIHCEEPKSHKGVSVPYPHFWVDRHDGKQSEEDKLLKRREPVDAVSLRPYLEELFHREHASLIKPFIVSDSSVHFKTIPPSMNATRDQLIATAAEQRYTAKEAATIKEVKAERPPPVTEAVSPTSLAEPNQAQST